MPSTSQLTALQARELDAGIIRTPPRFKPPADIAATRLLTDPLVVAVDPTHHLRTRREIYLAELRNERFVFYPRSYGVGIYDYFIQLCGKRSFVPTIVQEAREASTIIGLVATGLGIAVVPSSLRYIGIPNIVYVAAGGCGCDDRVAVGLSRGGGKFARCQFEPDGPREGVPWKDSGRRQRPAIQGRPKTRRRAS
jgi:DNA-binding transcriptional LysR family regulator